MIALNFNVRGIQYYHNNLEHNKKHVLVFIRINLVMDTESIFHTKPGFCGDCGAILPLVTSRGDIVCYTCGKQYSCDALGKDIIQFTINFNSVKETAKNLEDERKRKNIEEDDGPVVERKCSKCGNNKMSYATVQLRSADEGQTVFYTCSKCKHKEFENS